MDPRDRIQWVYSSKDKTDLQERYDAWAGRYEEELKQQHGYVSPQRAVEALVPRLPDRSATILDAGAGTGMVGSLLHALGYRHLVGIDLSEGMLKRAREKGVYRSVFRMVLGEPLAFPDSAFDAVISVGVFTIGHAPADAFDELVRVTKPGGALVFTVHTEVYEAGGFREKFEALEKEGRWTVVDASEPFAALPRTEPDSLVRLWTAQRL